MKRIYDDVVHVSEVSLPSVDYLTQADRDLYQLLVAERTMIFTDVRSEDFQKLLAFYEENLGQAESRFAKYAELAQTPEEKKIIPEFRTAMEEWKAVSRQVVDARASDTRAGRTLAIDLTIGEAADRFDHMRDYLDRLQMINEDIADKKRVEGKEVFNNSVLLEALMAAASLVVATFVAFFFSRSISKPLARLGGSAVRISEGDLDVETAKRHSKDEIGTLDKAFDRMVTALKYSGQVLGRLADGDFTGDIKTASDRDQLGRSLQKMQSSLGTLLGQANAAVDQVTTGSGQVAQAGQSLSQGSTEQAASLEEVTASLNQINSQSVQNSETASEASSVAKGSLENAKGGNEQMQTLLAAMKSINESSDEITKVVKVIDDIAFQINLLALNANVEAARAGKYGKGFAVVAEEVRNLAVRSAEAAKETTVMVESTIRNVEKGNKAAEATSAQLKEIVSGASKVADFLEEIALASKEQAQGMEQINQGLSQIDQVTQSNTANAEETAAAAEELASQAKQLRGLIARFKIADGKDEMPIEAPVFESPNTSAAGNGGDGSNGNGRAPEPVLVGAAGGDGRAPNPRDVIRLDDDDFGAF